MAKAGGEAEAQKASKASVHARQTAKGATGTAPARAAHRQALLVLGMHRSGTSALTGLLERLGAVGPKTPLQANEANPKGYGESRALMQLHDRLLESAGSRWDDWSEFNPGWVRTAAARRFGDDIRETVSDEFRDAELMAIKDPRVCRFAHYWIGQVEADDIDVHAIHVVRNPLEVARSLQARDGMNLHKGMLLWLRSVLDAEAATRGRSRVFVSYENLLADWRAQIDQICSVLDIAFPRRSPTLDLDVDGFLENALRHQRAQAEELNKSSIVPAWVSQTYAALVEASQDGILGEAASTRLSGILKAFNAASGIFAPVVVRAEHSLTELGKQMKDARQSAEAEAERAKEAEARLRVLEGEQEQAEARLRVLEEERQQFEAERVAAEVAQADIDGDVADEAIADGQAAASETAESVTPPDTEALDAARAEAEAAREEAETARQDAAAYQAEAESLKSRIEELAAQAEEAVGAALAAQAARNELEAELLRKDAERDSGAARLEAIEQEAERLREENNALQDALDTTEIARDELSRRQQHLELQIQHMRQRLQSFRQPSGEGEGDERSELVRRLRLERDRLTEQAQSYRTDLAEAEERERSLHRRLFAQAEKAKSEQAVDASGSHTARQMELVTRERNHWEEQARSAKLRNRELQSELVRARLAVDAGAASLDAERERHVELQRRMIDTLARTQYAKPVQSSLRTLLSGPAFDASHYVRQLRKLGVEAPQDPLAHFVNVGVDVGLDPHPLFDVDWYLDRNPDVRRAGMNPLHHYLRSGDAEGRSPHPLFDPKYYHSQYPDVAAAGLNTLCHYLTSGWREERDPNPWFYSKWYLTAYEDVSAAGMCPLVHYAVSGEGEGRRPHPSFDPEWYRSNHLGGVKSVSPLAHHLSEGRFKRNATHAIEGEEASDDRKTVLAIAHSAGDKLFGSERSFHDVVSSFDRSRFRVIVVLPAPHEAYVKLLEPVCDQVHFIRRAWWEHGRGNRPDILARYRDLIRNEGVDLVYANTIMLSEPMLAARECEVPAVCHVREAIDDDPDLQALVGKSARDIVAEVCARSDYIVANSKLTERLFSSPGHTFRIYNAVDVDAFDMPVPDTRGRPLVVGMLSSNIPKKGIADAVELAQAAEKEGLNVKFKLIGPETDETRRLSAMMKSSGRPSNVEFPGYVSDVVEAVSQLDVVISFSHFSESFGRTIAEASAARRPVIVYDHGALPEVVADGETGYVIPFRKPLAALEHLRRWSEDRALFAKMGEAARERAIALFSREVLAGKVNAAFDIMARGGKATDEDAGEASASPLPAPAQLQTHMAAPAARMVEGGLPAVGAAPVSVVIPNYNYENHLPERIESILRQTRKPAEIIFLDDCSSDRSVEVSRAILERSGIPFRIVTNTTNQGVYRQWLTGFSMASQPWVWIAEADDSCEPDFLESLLAYAHDDVNIVYAQSRKIDGDGNVIAADNRAHSNDISQTRWDEDYIEVGVREVADALAYRNTIPNGSAAILRKSALAGFEEKLATMRFTGDWMLYCHMLRTGKIAFVSRPLNHFRRHAGTVTSTQGKTVDYLVELARIREYFTENFPILPEQIARMNWFLDRDYKIDGVNRNSAEPAIAEILARAESHTADRTRVAFITTNNGSYYGGSEMLWREAAVELRAAGHDVFALIKAWEPRPDFFDELEGAGVKLLFKEEDGFEKLIARKPDLTVVSIGDQDEGIDFYSRLKSEGLPYVIVNQLTKEARFWPVRKERTAPVREGYEGARKVFFTCRNNHRVMEDRLGTAITNADMHFNPYHIDRSVVPDWPGMENGLQVAIPSKLLFIHKGQDILAEVVARPAWKSRDVTFNFFGIGPDEDRLRSIARDAGIERFVFHGRVPDISVIWRDNHALLMPSRMEGLPIMLISAMLSARVPIVTDIGGHAEVVRDGVSGFIAANPSVDDVESALQRAYDARNNWYEIGQQARRDVLDFLPEKPVADFIGKLELVLKSAQVRAAE